MPVPKFNIQQLLNLTNPALMNKGVNNTDNSNKYHFTNTPQGRQEAVIKEVEYRKRTNPIKYFQKHNSTDTTIKYKTNRNVEVGIDNKGNPTVQEYNTPVKNVEMTGNDPVGEFFITNAALKAPVELLGQGIKNIFRTKALYESPTSISYDVDKSFNPYQFAEYLKDRKIPYKQFSLSPADQNLIKMNNQRQIYWLPKELQKTVNDNLSKNVETTDEQILPYLSMDNTNTVDIVDFINNGMNFDKFNYALYKDIPIDKLQKNNFKDIIGTGGISYNRGDAYVARNTASSSTPIHEIEHQYQNKISGLNNPDAAFSRSQVDAYNKAYPSSEYTDISEKSATNKQLQKSLHDRFLKTGQEDNLYNFNKYIDNISDNSLLNDFFKKPVNDYHDDYQTNVFKDPDNINNWVNAYRTMLKYGTAVAAPVTLINNKR